MKKCGHAGFMCHVFKPVILPALFILAMAVVFAYAFNKFNIDGAGGISNVVGGFWLGVVFALIIIGSFLLYNEFYSSYKYDCEHSREKQ